MSVLRRFIFKMADTKVLKDIEMCDFIRICLSSLTNMYFYCVFNKITLHYLDNTFVILLCL